MPRVLKLPALLGWEGTVLSPNLYKTLSSRPQSYSVGVRSPTWIWVRLLSGAPACILCSLISIVMHTSNHLCSNFPPVLQVRKCTPGKRSTCIWTHASKCPSVDGRVLFVCFSFSRCSNSNLWYTQDIPSDFWIDTISPRFKCFFSPSRPPTMVFIHHRFPLGWTH